LKVGGLLDLFGFTDATSNTGCADAQLNSDAARSSRAFVAIAMAK
jgi:hypothetical protein